MCVAAILYLEDAIVKIVRTGMILLAHKARLQNLVMSFVKMGYGQRQSFLDISKVRALRISSS